jgi:hypothetical protein
MTRDWSISEEWSGSTCADHWTMPKAKTLYGRLRAIDEWTDAKPYRCAECGEWEIYPDLVNEAE